MRSVPDGLIRWSRPRYVWRRLLHNLPAKLLALGAALVLWSVATTDRRAKVEQSYDVPVTVSDTTGGRGVGTREVRDLTPATVRVTLLGGPERLRELRGENIEAVVDVTGVPETSFTRPVTVQAPTGTTLRSVKPERVQGFVDSVLTSSLPVVVSVASPAGDSLPRYELTPTEASVRGPGRLVTGVARVVASPVTLEPGEEREVLLIPLDETGRPVEGVTLTPSAVRVRRLDAGTLPVAELPVVLTPPPVTLRVTAARLTPARVRVVAPPEVLTRLREVRGTAAYHEGTYTAPVTLRLAAGAQALEPVRVELTVVRQVTPAPQAP
ncbi:CdaR family protein [Deinococcus hopiensis]|uniref:YbbR domain-containing protein n=1 Tax=Deinococcus hopiensis KR-140 TaxID=695939 RepID=A0A1W1VRQ9_9DEIO|nr:CdaR family protein [Deinococcus hopiensis]SMB95943.1 YbbR domain-containing protein [Deinococcus hopiensis KR-140]